MIRHQTIKSRTAVNSNVGGIRPEGGEFVRRFSLVREFFEFLWKTKMWWLLPIVIVFLLVGILIFITESSAVTPFIYTIF